MTSKFFSLEKEKQDRIINAAIREFAQKGYERASTNEIVKEAEISKGLLFHYFQTKKQLYLFLYNYCMDLLLSEFFEETDLDHPDFFLRIQQSMLIKMKLLYRHPSLFHFVESIYMEQAVEVRADVEKRIQEFTDANMNRMFQNVDYTLFREDVDVQRSLKIIIWTFERFGDEELFKAKLAPAQKMDYEAVFQEANEYLKILRACLYK